MTSIRTLSVASLAFCAAALIGCDQSKAELDSTKMQLSTATTERDSLKTQVSALQAQLDSTRKELDDLRSHAGNPGHEENHPVAGHEPTHHHAAGTAVPAPGTPAAKIDAEVQKKENTGATHFNR